MPTNVSTEQPTLWLLDGNAMIYRAYYAPFRNLSSPTGEPTRATYVFTQFLLNLLAEQKPTYLAVCMDVGDRETFRSEIYPDYKAHRPPPPEDLLPQRERILQIVEALGIPVLRVPGFEADDLLATLAERHAGQPECQTRTAEQQEGELIQQQQKSASLPPCPLRVVIVSRDKDLRQLLSERVAMYDPNDKVDPILTPQRMQKELGYTPAQAVEVQTLCGDSTDNVPGVKGVGDKTAVKLIAKYGSAAAVLAAAEEQTPALCANLQAFGPDMERTRKLVTLRSDVPLDFDLERSRIGGIDVERVLPIFKELGFSRLVDSLLAQIKPESPPRETKEATPPTTFSPTPSPQPPSSIPASTTYRDGHYTLINTPAALRELAEKLRAAKSFAFDTETTGFHCRELQLAGISVSFEPFTGFYLPLQVEVNADHEPPMEEDEPETLFSLFGSNAQHRKSQEMHLKSDVKYQKYDKDCHLSLVEVRQILGPVFSDPAVPKIAHNAKFDLLALRSAGIETAGLVFDTMLASFLLNPANRHGLKDLGRDLLHHVGLTYEEVTRRGKEELRFDQVPLEVACPYAAGDADLTWRLYLYFQPKLAQEPELDRLQAELELPLSLVLADMEWLGVRLDVNLLQQISTDLSRKLDELTRKIHALAGQEFAINSTKQLAEVLFDKLHYPVLRKTKTGRSTDAEVLEELAYRAGLEQQTSNEQGARSEEQEEQEEGSTPPAILSASSPLSPLPLPPAPCPSPLSPRAALPSLLLDYRELYKLRSTYLEPLAKLVCPATGRVHAHFNQIGAETGRLSCSDPNLQNIPIRTEVGREIRKAFVPGEPEWVILSADYSQIELRMLAHLSGDHNLRAAFDADADIHAYVAGQVFKVPLEKVSKEQRSRAKAVNFGIVYGQTAYGLARSLKISNEEAENFIREYKAQYEGIVSFLERCVAEARQHGFVRTILGRRRWIEGIADRNANRQAQARRLAINTVVQGSAADLIKQAMVNIHRRLHAENHPSRMLIQVHDELVFETPESTVEREAELIRQEMEHAFKLSVPVRVDLSWGRNWKEGK